MPLSNSQYDEIFRKYDEKQLASQHQLERRTKDVYARIPALKEIDDAIATCSVEQARRLLDGDAAALATLREKLSDYRRQKEQLLQEHGLASDYLKPVYHCPDCRDTGYVNGRRCHCFEQAAINLVYTQSNLKEILELLLRKNPNIRVVLNTVTVETLAEAASCFKKLAFGEPEIVCLQASNAKKAGRSHLMIAQNPVYIFTAQGGAKE